MAEIVSDVWIGNPEIARNENFIKKKNIKFFINCEQDFLYFNTESFSINLNLINYWKKVCSQIYDNILEYKSVLVYCNQNEKKSHSVFIAYFILYGNINLEQSIKIFQEKFDSRYFPNNFMSKNLKYLEKN